MRTIKTTLREIYDISNKEVKEKMEDEEINCFCGETMALSDCPDLYYDGMENNAEFNQD